jgi:alanine racemase
MHPFDGPVVEIDLSRIAENYRSLRAQFTGEACGAVVKADAYGLGAAAVSQALADAGCTTFFVATLGEAIELRQTQKDARIIVFHGVGEGEAMAYLNHHLTPVLNSPLQLQRWKEAVTGREDCGALLHLDTGMARLGFTNREFEALSREEMEAAQVMMLMSHLTCSSEPEHPMNEQQLDQFLILSEKFPELPTSLPASGGMLLGESWHDDLARPGCALYGINPGGISPDPVKPVVRLSAPVLQIRTLDGEQTVGYGATQTLPAGTRIATVALGYADGMHRSLSGKLTGYANGHKVAMTGRVTMDLLTFDISALAEDNMPQRIEIMNGQQTVNHLADMAGTIGYEILTSLGNRVERRYTNWSAE